MEKRLIDWNVVRERSQKRAAEYEQIQIEKTEQERKNFTRFQKSEDISVIDFMQSITDKDEFTENYLLFMKTMGKPMTASLAHCGSVIPGSPSNFVGEILENGLNAHYISLICSIDNPALRTFFGFIDRYKDGQYMFSRSHSFLVSQCGNYIYDVREQFRFDCYDGLGNLGDHIKNYFGVEIPYSILMEIFEQRPAKPFCH